MSQGIEHAWQLVQACELLGADDKYLDAIERMLRQRMWTWKESGQVLDSIAGWEISTGQITDPLQMYGLYHKPTDRDASR